MSASIVEFPCETWENEAGPQGVGSTSRPLAPSLDLTKEGIAMKATQAQCVPFTGSEKHFQDKASITLDLAGRTPALWAWITTTCGTRCLLEEHLRVHQPLSIPYPYGICVYCGRRSSTKDHLEPRNWTGDARRKFVVTVPACGTCNSLLRDTITTSITERRALAHARLRKHFRKVLRTVEFGPTDLADMGESLRQYVEDEMAKKVVVMAMLEWPTDVGYDLRAISASGIEDPYAVGLLEDPEGHQMLDRVRKVA